MPKPEIWSNPNIGMNVIAGGGRAKGPNAAASANREPAEWTGASLPVARK
jgi:hypothetical protein